MAIESYKVLFGEKAFTKVGIPHPKILDDEEVSFSELLSSTLAKWTPERIEI
jgi:hypothetical protein